MRTQAHLLPILFLFCLIPFGDAYLCIAQSNIQSDEIEATISKSRTDDAFWAVMIRDSSGTVLEAYNGEKLVRPASNLKLLTSAAILDELGSEFTYKTPMYGFGYQEGGNWIGDIIIEGSGDPSISGTFYDDDRFHVFDKFYMALDTLGIRHISGSLIGSDALFDQQVYPKGWNWDDLSFYYGVEISALSFNNNAVDLTVRADGKVGDTPSIQWFPFDTDYVNFINEQVITPPGTEYDEFYRRVMGTNTIILRSKLPKGYLEEESLSVLNAPMYFMDTFQKYLEDGGISVERGIIIDNQTHLYEEGEYVELASHQSVPLSELLKQVNKESSNFYTEMLLKTMAAEHFGAQGSTELGLEIVRNFAESMNMDTTKMSLSDGSGMSPSTLMKINDLTLLLVNLQQHDQFPVFFNSLSIGGRDGSLKYRFGGTPLVGKFRGKSGYVSGVRALSGYMTAKSGRRLIVGIVTNNYAVKTSYIDAIHETILTRAYHKY